MWSSARLPSTAPRSLAAFASERTLPGRLTRRLSSISPAISARAGTCSPVFAANAGKPPLPSPANKAIKKATVLFPRCMRGVRFMNGPPLDPVLKLKRRP